MDIKQLENSIITSINGAKTNKNNIGISLYISSHSDKKIKILIGNKERQETISINLEEFQDLEDAIKEFKGKVNV